MDWDVLIGVGVGAVTTGAATYLTDSLRHKRETDRLYRQDLRTLYARFTALARRHSLEMGVIVGAKEADDIQQYAEKLEALALLMLELDGLVSEIDLAAPADTGNAARDLQRALNDRPFDRRDPASLQAFSDSLGRFTAIAKRDLKR